MRDADLCGFRYERAEAGEVQISRPECTWHPENRMNWPVNDDHWDPTTNPWAEANVPSPDHTWDWETAFANVDKVNATRRATKRMLWSAAYRVGVELSALAQKLADVDRTLSKPAEWDHRALQLQDLEETWQKEFERPEEKGVRPVSYVSVVKEGYPRRWKQGMTEEQAVEIVRRGMIDELSAGDSTLWPSRPRFSRVDGKDVMTLHRERIWEWARPEVVGKKKQFFSVNRWPVHLQSEKTQTEIRMGVINEKAKKEREEEEIAIEMAKAEARALPTKEEVQKTQLARSLSVPYHEVNDSQTQFFPGHTEYWEGDTPLQKRVIEGYVQRVIQEELGPNDGKAPRGTSWLGRGHTKASGTSGGSSGGRGSDAFTFLDVEPEVVPRSVPARATSPATGQMVVDGVVLDRLPQQAPPPRVIERRQPLLSQRYPQSQESRRRVRFEDEEQER
ncbi:hypothetical protein ColLi_07057 [Colletotrichum liriopes]|uniref:Uncharacterized protein n=1 Tax=Colletotrichum liriopes TaxID=708192 RepID=A0AA37LTE6_9PEZI|nr:hypothetical protein ColLi_07057 [Colletotrichum liriopes]